jgi:branched-chain amino acid transport system permease protein
MMYVLVAAGLSIIFGVMDVLNVAHGELLALGAYLGFTIISEGITGSFWLALVAAPIAVAVFSMAIERFTIRRVYDRGHLAHVLLTFGWLLVIYDMKQIVWGKQAKLFTPPQVINHSVDVLGFSYSLYSYFMIASGALLAASTWALLNYTKFGLVIRAGSQDRGMVRNLGIDIDRYYTLIFGFGAALAAFGGVVLGGYQNVNLEMGNAVVIPAFVIVVLGGLGSFRGAVVGGLGVGIIQSVLSTYIPQLQGLVIFLIMIAVLIFRPRGLFGETDTHSSTATEESEFTAGTSASWVSDALRTRAGLATVAVLALLPLGVQHLYSSFVVTVLIHVLIWALFAMSLDIILGYGGLISLGHAMFYGLGAYATVMTFIHLSPSVFVGVAIAVALSAVLAWFVGRLAIRVSGVYFVMITLAFAQLVANSITKFDVTGGNNGLFGPTPFYGIGGVGVYFDQIVVGMEPLTVSGHSLFYYFLLAIVVAAYLFARRVMRAPFGTVLQSIRESETRARFIGYDTQAFKRRAFVLSGTLAGLSGALFGVYQGYAAPAFLHWINSGDVIVMAVLGGVGTLFGPMIGAGVFVIFEEELSAMVPFWRLLLGAFFILIVLFLPRGLVSLPGKVAELTRDRSDAGLPADEQEVRD